MTPWVQTRGEKTIQTPWERYISRQQELIDLRKQLEEKELEIENELDAAQEKCTPHIDDGGMFEGSCTKCGKLLG